SSGSVTRRCARCASPPRCRSRWPRPTEWAGPGPPMSALVRFRAPRPAPAAAAQGAAVPSGLVGAADAPARAGRDPPSPLHGTRWEIDLPEGVDPYDARVYERARQNLDQLIASAPLVVDDEPSLYCYRLRMGQHVQTGLAGCFSVDEYD